MYRKWMMQHGHLLLRALMAVIDPLLKDEEYDLSNLF